MKTKRLIALALSAILMLGLVACGGTEEPGSDRPIQLSIQLFEGGYGRVWLDKVVAAYEAIRTDVHITVKTTVNSISAEQLVNAGKSPYDIVMLNYGFWQDSYDGKIVDLTDVYLSTPEGESATIMDKCNDTIVEFFNIGTAEDPKFNQMSWAAATSALCYNKTTLDAVLGEGNWEEPKTTDEFLALCERVQGDASQAYGFVFSGKLSDTILLPTWTAQYMGYEAYYNYCHGMYMDENGNYVAAGYGDGAKLTAQNGSLPGLKVQEILCSKYAHPYSLDLEFNNAQKVFCGYGSGVKKQLVAFMANGDWLESEVSMLLANKPQDIRMMKVPMISAIIDKCSTISDDATLSAVIDAIDNGATSYDGVSAEDFARIADARKNVASLSDIHALAIPASSQNVEEAKNFLKFLFSDAAQKIYAQEENGLTMPYGYNPAGDSDVEVSPFVQSVNDCLTGDINMVYNPDYSSPLMFFGGWGVLDSSAQNTFFEGASSAETIYNKMVQSYTNRWDQIYKASGGK